MNKIVENKLRKIIRKILLENSKVQSIESEYLDNVKSGAFDTEESPDQ